MTVSLEGLFRGYCESLGHQAHCYESAVFAFSTQSQMHFLWVVDSIRAALCLQSGLWYLWTGSQRAVMVRRVSYLGTSGSHLCFLQMLIQTMTSSMHWNSLQLSVKWLSCKFAPPNPRPCFPAGNQWTVLSGMG